MLFLFCVLSLSVSFSFGTRAPVTPHFQLSAGQSLNSGEVVTDPRNPPSVGDSQKKEPEFGPAWEAAYVKARAKIDLFSVDEIVNITTGVGWLNGRCVGNIAPIDRKDGNGWPGLCLEDSPLGVRFADFVTAFPAGINVAATFDRNLMRQRGIAMGLEHVKKGVNVALGPMVNLGRVPNGGRNWEGFGADPYLSGEAAYETILGMQASGVQACAKHYLNNEQEYHRNYETSEVDDRTQHEIYAHPFMRSVMAGVASVMCSYNLVNGTYACQNDQILNKLLKNEFGFRGYIMSDWSATHSTSSAAAGLDMTMPGDITFGSGTSYFGKNLTSAIASGSLTLDRLKDMGTRILASYYLLRQDSPSFPRVNFDAFKPENETNNEHVDVQDDHGSLVRKIGAASCVLLKNTNGSLPLVKPRTLALIGSDAGPAKYGPNAFSDQGGVDGILAMGWGSGTAYFPYLISPYEAIQSRARQDHTSMTWYLGDDDLDQAARAAMGKSAAVVFINSDSGEEYITVDGNVGDRNNLTAWHGGDRLVQAVAGVNQNTIVVVNSVGPLIIEPWIENPNVTAVLWAGLQGQEAGNSIADVLYGDWNPSGKLPYTIARRVEDYPANITRNATSDKQVITVDYSEGLMIDYRHFDARNIIPRFEFGFGLSYSNFSYHDLCITAIEPSDGEHSDLREAWANGKASPSGEVGSSTASWLHRPAYSVSFTVQNTGSYYGAEAAQLYLNMPQDSGEPPNLLRGFANPVMTPGESKTVELMLSLYDLSIWDVVAQGWRRPKGEIGVTIGSSSRDARLKGSIP